MSDEATRAAGVGQEVEIEGKKYRISERTPEWTGLMNVWLQTQAWDALDRMEGIWPPHKFQQRADRLHAEITAGAYSWGSTAMARAMMHPDGMKEGMYYAILANDRTITREIVERFFAASEKKAMAAWERANPPDPRTAPAAGQDSI